MITPQTEPRPSFLWAIWFTGLVLSMLVAKGHVWAFVGEIGRLFTYGASGWLVARAWYLSRSPSKRVEYDVE